MDEDRFDSLTRSWVRGPSRRKVFKGLASILGGAAGMRAAASGTDARTRNPIGAICSSPRDCQSGLCVDGVCCDSPCLGVCEACNLAGLEGVCTPVVGDPVGGRGPCPGDGSVCTGACDGVTTSNCASFPGSEAACGGVTCDGGYLTSQVCSGDGLCITISDPCEAGCAADGLTCRSGCEADADCPSSMFCVSGVCLGDLTLGALCERGEQCQLGHCVDGVCCDAACDGACQACGADGFCGDGPDDEPCDGGACCGGTCTNVTGELGHCGTCGNACAESIDPCLVAVCVNGECGFVPNSDGTPCSTGNACTTGDACVNGACVEGEPVVCDSDNRCIIDSCDTTLGCVQEFKINGAACDDENLCDGREICDGAGHCVEGTPVVCLPSDQCHEVGVCNPETGECSNPMRDNYSPCNDEDSCSTNDYCWQGVCTGLYPNFSSDPENCGGCGNDCWAWNGNGYCGGYGQCCLDTIAGTVCCPYGESHPTVQAYPCNAHPCDCHQVGYACGPFDSETCYRTECSTCYYTCYSPHCEP